MRGLGAARGQCSGLEGRGIEGLVPGLQCALGLPRCVMGTWRGGGEVSRPQASRAVGQPRRGWTLPLLTGGLDTPAGLGWGIQPGLVASRQGPPGVHQGPQVRLGHQGGRRGPALGPQTGGPGLGSTARPLPTSPLPSSGQRWPRAQSRPCEAKCLDHPASSHPLLGLPCFPLAGPALIPGCWRALGAVCPSHVLQLPPDSAAVSPAKQSQGAGVVGSTEGPSEGPARGVAPCRSSASPARCMGRREGHGPLGERGARSICASRGSGGAAWAAAPWARRPHLLIFPGPGQRVSARSPPSSLSPGGRGPHFLAWALVAPGEAEGSSRPGFSPCRRAGPRARGLGG